MQSMTYMHFLCRPELARVTNSAESVLSFDRRSCQYSIIMPPPVGKGTISVAFVRPSVAYTANNSRTQRPSVQKFGRKIPHFDATRIPVSRSNGQRSRSPGLLILTHIVHIFRTAMPTNFKLGIRMEDDDPHQPHAPRPPRSKVKVKVT